MSLEGVCDVPMYSASVESADLWSELDGGSWNGTAQQSQLLSQVPLWQSQPQQVQQQAPQQAVQQTLQQKPQQIFGWPNAALAQNYGAMPDMSASTPLPWASNNDAMMPAVPMPGEWPQNAETVRQMKSPAFPVNQNYNACLPVHYNNAATLRMPHTNAAWAVGSSQALANPAWYQQTPLTGKTLAQSVSSNQVTPVQIYQNNADTSKNINLPHFNITITPNRIARKVTKRKRVRTAFTTDQILALEKVYSTQTYVNKDERLALTEKLKISDRAIKVWFQNRRMKGKREIQAAECSDEYEPESTEPELTEARLEPSTSSDSYGSPSSELDYIEAQIQRTDENGYVTLDDKALDSLFNVIGAFVPKVVELVKKETVPKKEVIYDPISPVDTTSSATEQVDQYELPTDEKGLQKLFDRHFC